MRERESDELGFTLIEMLVVVVVVGILAAVAIVGIGGVTSTANNAGCKATIDASSAAVTAYYAGHASTYPTTFSQVITASDLTLHGSVQNPGAGATLTNNAAADGWTITLGPNGQLTATGPDSTGCPR